MSLRVAARGQAPAVLLFLVGPQRDDDLRATFPNAAILADDKAPTQLNKADLTSALARVGLPPDAPVVLCGYSAGCQAVRALLLAGVDPVAAVTIDGTHASMPPASWQIDVWRALAAEARRGERVWVATCTQQLYTERLDAAHRFTATRHVLEQAVGQRLDPGTEIHEAGLHVISYESKDIDADAHIVQGRSVLPEMLRRYVAPLFGPAALADWQDVSKGLGERLIAWYHAEKASGVRESPAGSNTGPRIRQYLACCRRRGSEKPLGLTAGAWCSAMASFGLQQVAQLGEAYPAPRAAGVELEDDAKDNGSWHDVAEVKSGAWRPAAGDIVMCMRGTGWQRHVCVLLESVSADGSFQTIGGNEDDQIKITPRKLTDPILGFIELPRKPGSDQTP